MLGCCTCWLTLTIAAGAVCELLGIEKVNTSGYHPQTDGMVEKFNSTIINMLSKCVEKHGRDWDKQLPYVMLAYRVAVQESTDFVINTQLKSLLYDGVRTCLSISLATLSCSA